MKSAILLAGLSADGPTRVVEPVSTRDHTERLLRLCGLSVTVDGTAVTLTPGAMQPFGLRVPGDLSSAAFFLALAAARTGWRMRCPGVGLNPGRTGILDILTAMGAGVTVDGGGPDDGVGEPEGTVVVTGAPLGAVTIGADLVPRCVDELPVIALLATQAEGETVISGAAELRHKESDRISALADGLRRLGGDVEERTDGLAVRGPTRLRGARLASAGDHRLAMTWAVAGCLTAEGVEIDGAEVVEVSYPGFFEALQGLLSGSR